VQSHSSESRDENSDAQVVVRLPPPRADVNFTPVFALSLSMLQQAAAAAAAMLKSTKVEHSLIDCIPGFEIVRVSLRLADCVVCVIIIIIIIITTLTTFTVLLFV
jgi:hypothetical protein